MASSLYAPNSEKYVKLFDRFGVNARDIEGDTRGWALPGMGEPYYDCGTWRGARGCLSFHQTLNEGNGQYVELYKRSCNRKECPICYESWCMQRANKITWRILNYFYDEKYLYTVFKISNDKVREKRVNQLFLKLQRIGKPVDHVVISVPEEEYYLTYKELKKKMRKMIKNSGIKAYAYVFHPFRKIEKGGAWYYSPHFHLLSYGFVNTEYDRLNWVLVKQEKRKSVFATATYLVSHCGVKKNIHAIVWGGYWSYNKLKINKIPRVIRECPYCKKPLVELLYIGSESHNYYDDDGHPVKISFLDKSNDWVQKLGGYF